MRKIYTQSLCTLLLGALILTGCDKKTETITVGSMEIQYSDDSITVEYKNNAEDEFVNDYESEQVLDLFEGIDDWFLFSGTDGKGEVEVVIPDDYVRECKGFYFKKCTSYGVENELTIVYDNEHIGYVSYWIPDYDGNAGYSAGDTYEVVLNFIPADIMQTGKLSITQAFADTGYVLLCESMQYVFPEQG